MSAERKLEALAALAVAALALLRFGPDLAGAAWLADDYALATLVLPGSAPPAVSWAEVLRQLHEPWLYSAELWRPFVSLSFGLNASLLGFTAISFAAGNLLMHAGTAALASLLATRLCAGSALAGLLVGATFALHPLSVEPVSWISARTTTLEVLLRMAALVAFLGFLRGRRAGRWVATAALALSALLSKESAVALPLQFLAIDLLDRWRRPVRERLALHLAFVPLWLAYAAARFAVVGALGSAHVGLEDLAAGAAHVVEKLESVVAPTGGAVRWAAAGMVLLVLFALVARRGRAGLRAFGADLVAHGLFAGATLATTLHLAMLPGLFGARYLYELPICAALFVQRGLTGDPHRGRANAWRLALALPLIAAGWPVAEDVLEHYRRDRGAVRGFSKALAQADAANPASPALAILSMPTIHASAVFACGIPPFGPAPRSIRSLAGLLVPQPSTSDGDAATPDLYLDPDPVHAMLDIGCTVLYWHLGKQQAAWLDPRSPGEGTFEVMADGRVDFGREIEPMAFAAIELQGEAASGSIAWITNAGRYEHAAAVEFAFRGDERRCVVDVSHHGGLLVGQVTGVRLLGLDVQTRSGRVHSVGLRRTGPATEPQPFAEGQDLRLGDLAGGALLPPAASGVRRELVLVSGSIAMALAVDATGRCDTSRDRAEQLATSLRFLRGGDVHAFVREYDQGKNSSRRSRAVRVCVVPDR